MNWTRHKGSSSLAAATEYGLYTISRGGEGRRDFVLRFLTFTSSPAEVLGIHRREVDAIDEAERHHKEKSNAKVPPNHP